MSFEPQMVEDQNIDKYDDMLVELEADSINYEEFLANLQNMEPKPVLEEKNFETVSSDIQPLVILEFQEPQFDWMKLSTEPKSDKDDDIGDEKANETEEEAESVGELVEEVLCEVLRDTPVSMETKLDEIEEPIQRFPEIDAELEEPTSEWFQLKDVMVAHQEEEEELETTENVQAMTEIENKDLTTEKAKPIVDFEDRSKDKGDVNQASTKIEPAVEDEFLKDEKVEHILPQETKEFALELEEIESATDDKQLEQPINNVIPLEDCDRKVEEVMVENNRDESSEAAKPIEEPNAAEDKVIDVVTSNVDLMEDIDVDQSGELTLLVEEATQHPKLSVSGSEVVQPKEKDSDQVVSAVGPEREGQTNEQTQPLPDNDGVQLTVETLQPKFDPAVKEIGQRSTKVDPIADDDDVDVEDEKVDDVFLDQTKEFAFELEQLTSSWSNTQLEQPINNVIPSEEDDRKDEELVEATGSDDSNNVVKLKEEPSEATEDKVFDIVTNKIDPMEDNRGDEPGELTVLAERTTLLLELSTYESPVVLPEENVLNEGENVAPVLIDGGYPNSEDKMIIQSEPITAFEAQRIDIDGKISFVIQL